MPVPPALAASSKPQQEFDYDYERKVMSNDASTSFDTFLDSMRKRGISFLEMLDKYNGQGTTITTEAELERRLAALT